jgi:hypothetical protein
MNELQKIREILWGCKKELREFSNEVRYKCASPEYAVNILTKALDKIEKVVDTNIVGGSDEVNI